jgi:tRNA(Ile)-lysidine synthase
VTSSDSSSDPTGRGLAARAGEAFDILFGKQGTIGLAVSGGSDSTALLLLTADWAKERNRSVIAATVDHGLRPEAKDEALQAGRLCGKFGVPHTLLTWNRPPRPGPVAQAQARQARHGLLAGWARQTGAPVIALGHTRDDRFETFLMRARQGSGWHGLAGPLPLAPAPVWPEGRGVRLARPLLAFGREELRDHLRGHRVEWIEDPSNTADRFERVRMRTMAAQLDTTAREKALRVMDGLARIRAAVAAEARAALPVVDAKNDEWVLAAGTLAGLGAQARLRLAEALVMAAGGAEKPPRREALGRLVSRIGLAGSGGGLTLAGAWIRWGGGRISFSAAPARRDGPPATAPAWERAAQLLADPALAALAV